MQITFKGKEVEYEFEYGNHGQPLITGAWWKDGYEDVSINELEEINRIILKEFYEEQALIKSLSETDEQTSREIDRQRYRDLL